VVAVGRLDAIAAFLATAQALFLHESRHAIASMAASFFAQLFLDARNAVGLAAARMNLVDLLGQRLIFQGSRAGTKTPPLPVVIAAGGNFQVKTKCQDGMIIFHRVDPFIPLEDGSESMPSVFFRIMHCSRK
jgi:hypothetical protein